MTSFALLWMFSIIFVLSLVEAKLILLSELKDANQEMGQVIESIRQIAQHTNLLSLNSAIEAARAGEAGRG
ncbi:hypothetical protein JCM17380_26540 [Desulfosporosinus burensis]